MATPGEIISKATITARKDWYRFTIAQENEIIKLYEKARDSLLEQIRKSTKDNIIMKARRESLLAEINSDLNILRASLNAKIRMGMKNSIDYGIKSGIWSMNAVSQKNTNLGTSWVGVDNLIRRYDASRTLYANSMWGKINRETMDFLLRYRPGGMEFSDSIWDSTWGVQKQMRNMVNQSVLLGDSSQKLATQLTKYLSKEGLKTGPGIYKSAYSNAWRLARTEMNRAYTEGQIRYAATKDFIDGFIWRTGSGEPCDICAELDGQFFPKDQVPEIPHPNCLPADIFIAPSVDIRWAIKRWYKGKMITFQTASGKQLTCTPNHPILTNNGFLAANLLNVGSTIICDDRINFTKNNIQTPSRIEDIFDSLSESISMPSIKVPVAAEDFHGDGIGSEVAVIASDSFLRNKINSSFFQKFAEYYLFIRNISRHIFDSLSMATFSIPGNLLSPSCNICGFSHSDFFFGSILRRPQNVSRLLSPYINSGISEPFEDSSTRNIESDRQLFLGDAGQIKRNNFIIRQLYNVGARLDKIVHINSFDFIGNVFNLETKQSYYIANGIATHNCMCWREWHIADQEMENAA